MTTTILALDLGKFNSVLVWFEPESRSTAFRTVKTTPELLRAELTRQPVSQVVFVACSQAGWVHDLCEELKLPSLVASTTGAAWQWKRVKRKTDRDDALKLARLLDAQTREVESKLDELAKSDSRVSLLETVPGGTRTAEVIAVHLPDAKRFHSADEVSAYAGLVPRQYQSGETDRRGRITSRSEVAPRGARGVCVVQPALQPLGEGDVAATADERAFEEEGDRGVGAEAVGPLLGDPADGPAVEVAGG